MPVSTRSQIVTTSNEQSQDLTNPHHGLKEKMRALTLLYEQQKRASFSLKNNNHQEEKEEENEPRRFTTHPSADLLTSSKKQKEENRQENRGNAVRENSMALRSSSVATRTYVFPRPSLHLHEAKENLETDIEGFAALGSCPPRKAKVGPVVARKLSMGNFEAKKIGGEAVGERAPGNIIGGESRILVFVRLRPMAKKERETGSRSCVRIVNRRDVYLTEFAADNNDYLRLKRLRGRHFAFDASFPETTSQQEVYLTTTAELVEAVLQGRNGSVFCYGATGAGKTYTMLGTLESPGVMVLAIKDLFTKIRQRSCDGNHVVHLSYLEVYNETVRDLISPGRPLVLREDKQGIVAAGLTQYRAYSTDEVMALLLQGNRNRTTEPTRANETSSRSHAILQVVVEYRARDEAMNVVSRLGKLSLIDLAGSERALATDQRTLRSLEGANINRSLLALSSCINALVEGKKHIPYRNSKLTQLLKDSLGGACNTVMIANISPSSFSFGETQNTLHWADRAKEIRTKACEENTEIQQVPESGTDQAKLLLELQKENRDLRVQLARQQQKVISLQAQFLASNFSPTPSSITSIQTPPSTAQPNEKRRPRTAFLGGTCFTPESNKRDLQRTVKELQAEIERMKKDHALQLKKKGEFSQKSDNKAQSTATRSIVTRASLRPPKEPRTGETKSPSPSQRFRSPAPTAKKRSFWDITAANSPSVATLNGRKTKSQVISEPGAAPSMLLQPGFARQKPDRVW